MLVSLTKEKDVSVGVTGPFSDLSATIWAGKHRWWYRGARDDSGKLILAPHPFKTTKYRAVGPTAMPFPVMGNQGACYYYPNPKDINTAYTVCYDRFAREAWGDAQTQLAVDLAERHSTLDLLSSSFGRMAKAVRQVRQRRFSQAWRTLVGKKRPPPVPFGRVKWQRGTSDEAFFNNWMELRYGWGPLMGSIQSFCDVLTKPVKGADIRASGKATQHIEWFSKGELRHVYDWVHRCKMQATVSVSDPLLASLNQYGLVNWASVAYELVTLSFVLDWFVPVGKIIEDQTRFIGLSFSNAFTTYKTQATEWYGRYYTYESAGCTVYSELKQRELWTGSPPAIPNRWQIANGLNAKRCMDSLALLTGALRGR